MRSSIYYLAVKNGTEDIISVRSKAFQQLDCDIDDLSVSRLVEIVKQSLPS